MKKKKFYLFVLTCIVTLFSIISCGKEKSENNVCNVSNPVEELVWLKTMTNNLSEYDFIMIANYKGETIFYRGNCNPLANYVSSAYKCNGDVIGYVNDIRSEISGDKLLWKHKDSKCNFSR